MKIKLFFVIALMCSVTTSVWALPIIDVGTIEALPDTTYTFAVNVTGGGNVQGLDFYIQIGDGGTVNGGTGTMPIITNIDIVGPGTLFSASNTGQQNTYNADLLWAVSTTTDPNKSNFLDANGVIAFVTIDTTGTISGESYSLLLSDVADDIIGDPGIDTAFADVSAQITNGTINIISEQTTVPEPASVTLIALALGGFAVLRRRKRQ